MAIKRNQEFLENSILAGWAFKSNWHVFTSFRISNGWFSLEKYCTVDHIRFYRSLYMLIDLIPL